MKDFEQYWTEHSVCNIEQNDSIYQYGIALVVVQTIVNNLFPIHEFLQDESPNSFEQIQGVKIPAFMIPRVLAPKNISVKYWKHLYCDFKYRIEDGEGNVIFNGMTQSFAREYPDGGIAEFKVTPEQIKLIAGGKVKVVALSVSMQYGVIQKSFPEKNNLNKIEYKNPKFPYQNIDVVEKHLEMLEAAAFHKVRTICKCRILRILPKKKKRKRM